MFAGKILRTITDYFIQLREKIQAIRNNDQQVLKTLYVENYETVRSFVIQNNGSEEDAKDIYQETFVAVWRNVQLEKFQPLHESALAGYFYTIARNKWLQQLRKAKNKLTVSLLELDLTADESEEVSEELELFSKAVQNCYKLLDKRCRELLSLFYFRKKSLREIADQNTWTEASAKNNKYRCLQKLRLNVVEYLQ